MFRPLDIGGIRTRPPCTFHHKCILLLCDRMFQRASIQFGRARFRLQLGTKTMLALEGIPSRLSHRHANPSHTRI